MSSSAEALTAAWNVHQGGDYAAAETAYRQVLAAEPQNSSAWCYLGIVLHDQRRFEDAEAAYKRAIEINPSFAVAWNNMGNTLSMLRREQDSLNAYDHALKIRPNYASAFRNKGVVLLDIGRMAEAEKAFNAAITINPNDWESLNGNAIFHFWTGRISEAVAGFRAVLKEKPEHLETRKNLGVALMLEGNYIDGCREYDWRLKNKSLIRVTHQVPLWDGSPLAGRTLMLEAEQGMGDTIHFIRYAQEIKRLHEGRVICAVEKQLVPLLTGVAGADVLIGQNESRPPFDLWAPLLSLPGIMKHDPSNFPAPVPYLKADPQRVERWKARLAGVSGIKIGITWQGNKANWADRKRSFPLAALAPVGKLSGVTLISLQKGDGNDQLEALTDFPVLSLGDDFDSSGGAFMDTAAVMQSLDLVITADTSVGHLAGALGVPVWTALAFVPDWRWLIRGDTTRWYPTMRLFRQQAMGDWNGVFQRIASALASQYPALRPKKPSEFHLAGSGFNKLSRTRHGLFVYNRNDAYIGKSLNELGEFSEGETDLFRQLIRPGSTIVEAGSNIGAHTVPLARLVGNKGLVHAFEPQRIVFQTLCANVALNSLTNVHCHNSAVGDRPGSITVPYVNYEKPNNFGGLSLGEYQEGERVPVVPLDSLNLTRCDLLKIDVEGMEINVLRGAAETIRKLRPVIYLENDRPQNSAALISELLALGYQLYWHLPTYYSHDNYYANPENPFGNTVSVNMLGIHSAFKSDIKGLRKVEGPQSDWRTPA
jgi:FkbM family methyltransferase